MRYLFTQNYPRMCTKRVFFCFILQAPKHLHRPQFQNQICLCTTPATTVIMEEGYRWNLPEFSVKLMSFYFVTGFQVRYRVSHIETYFLNWLWQIEICKLEFVWRWFWNPEVWIYEFHQPVCKKVISADLNSLWQKRYRYQWKFGFFMIHSTKKDQFWSFDCQGVSNHQDQYFFLMKWGCKGQWGHGGCWGCRGHWGHRGSKA